MRRSRRSARRPGKRGGGAEGGAAGSETATGTLTGTLDPTPTAAGDAPGAPAAAPGAGPLLVWGLDGTVVDSYPAIRAAVHTALGAHGLQLAGPSWATEAILRPLVGLSLDRIFGRLVYHHDPDPGLIDSLVAAYREAFRAAAPRLARLQPGMAALLARLRARGAVSVVACSDGPGAELVLECFALADRFAGVVSDNDVARPRRKPDPGLVVSACATLGYAPGNVVVIGDSVFDVEMGQAAGADTVWVAWGNQSRGDLVGRTPTCAVENVDDLGAVLDEYVAGERRTAARGGTGHSAAVRAEIVRRGHHPPAARRPAARPRRHRQWALGRCGPRR
ncbi:MAG TPA: HAD family hydrolase [Acidimicrobiales bacterium]